MSLRHRETSLRHRDITETQTSLRCHWHRGTSPTVTDTHRRHWDRETSLRNREMSLRNREMSLRQRHHWHKETSLRHISLTSSNTILSFSSWSVRIRGGVRSLKEWEKISQDSDGTQSHEVVFNQSHAGVFTQSHAGCGCRTGCRPPVIPCHYLSSSHTPQSASEMRSQPWSVPPSASLQ